MEAVCPETSLEKFSAGTELLTGPYRSGKTSRIIDEILNFKAEKPFSRILVLVPSARYAGVLKERINKRLKEFADSNKSFSGFFGFSIQPFYHACLEISKAGSKDVRLIPEELRPVLLAELISELRAENKISDLLLISGLAGTSSAILELIDEFQRAGLSPDALLAKLEESACQESKPVELANIYAAYFKKMKELGYYDQKSLALQAREELFASSNNSKKKKHDQYDLILIDGFDRISHLQAQVFAGICRNATRSIIAFDYIDPQAEDNAEEEIKILRQKTDDYRWKENSFRELFNILSYTHESGKGLTITRTENKTFEPAAVEACLLLDRQLEMTELAREVKNAIAARNLSHQDIVVVCRSPDSYNGAIESAFEDAGLAYFIDGSASVSELAPWRFIRSLFTLSKKGYQRKDLIDILRSPYMNLEALGLQARDLSMLDRDSFEAKLIGSKESWTKFISSKEAYSGFSAGLAGFLNELELEKRKGSAREHASLLEDYIERYMKLPASEADLRSLKAQEERELIKALRRSLKVLLLQDSLNLLKSANLDEFWLELELLIEKSNYQRPRPLTPAVTICSAELLPNQRFKEIYVCGMAEGEFPRHQRARGFLSLEETRLWLSYGIDIRNPRQEAGFERALFYSIAERAEKRLFLSLSQFGSASEELLPSFYLTEIQDATGLVLKSKQPFESKLPISSRDLLCSAMFRGGFAGAQKISGLRESTEKLWQEMEAGVLSCLIRSRSNTNHEHAFNGNLQEFFHISAFKSNPEKNKWTATKINDYGKCPFKYWVSHQLELKPRKEAEAGLNYAFLGLFYHKVLELFFSSISKRQDAKEFFKFSKDPQTELALKNLIEESFAGGITWLTERHDFKPGPYWEQEKKNLRFRIERFIAKELARIESKAGFIPQMFELQFGTDKSGAYPPLILRAFDGEEIIIRGSIDRVDLFVDSVDSPLANQAMIVDYKSGTRKISVREAEKGTNLQLPVYALALEKSVLAGCSILEADYLSINAAEPVGHMDFASDKCKHLIVHAENLVKEYNRSAKQGVFTVRPKGLSVCRDCDHATVCRVSELNLSAEEEDDANSD